MTAIYENARLVINLITRFISPPAVALEWALVIAAVLIVASAPLWIARPLAALRALLARLAASTRLAILVCALVPIAVRLAMPGVAPPPDPSIHDEFSHLLLADTLAHGRLTNATHPMWQHFESIHIIQQPTYNSMYPPAHGSVLAAGQVVFGNPWAGVVLAFGIMSAAICWMMQGWLPRTWAFYGTLILILKLGITGLWIDSYLSGAVPATGGALLIGALPRLRRPDSRTADAVLAALGMVILMNSRPFEGAVLSAIAMLWIARAVYRRMLKSARHVLRLTVAPALIVLAAGFVVTGYYSWRVTGSPLRMPYQVNRDTYGWPENLAFLPPEEVTFRHQLMADMHAKEVQRRQMYDSVEKLLNDLVAIRLFDNWAYLVGPVLSVPLMLVPLMFRDRRTRALVLFIAIIALLNLAQLVLYPYHLAPVVPILFALAAEGSRRIYNALARTGPHRALAFAAIMPACLVLVAAVKQNAAELRLSLSYWENGAEPHREARADITEWLSARPAKQLVIVRYAEGHSPDQEWVYNNADIDGSKVVWAREMDPASDARLLQYFSDREAWLLDADVHPLRVVRYGRPLPPLCPTGPGGIPREEMP